MVLEHVFVLVTIVSSDLQYVWLDHLRKLFQQLWHHQLSVILTFLVGIKSDATHKSEFGSMEIREKDSIRLIGPYNIGNNLNLDFITITRRRNGFYFAFV